MQYAQKHRQLQFLPAGNAKPHYLNFLENFARIPVICKEIV